MKCNFLTKNFLDLSHCPLDHCSCNTHDVDNQHHNCDDDRDDDVLVAELAAGALTPDGENLMVKNLKRGDVVIALKDLDTLYANVRLGTIGVVFEEADAYELGSGPMVRWLNMGCCNVYEGDVSVVRV